MIAMNDEGILAERP